MEDSVGYLRNEGAVKFNDFKNSGTYRGSKTGESELKEADPDAETDGPIIGERSDVIKLVNKDSGKNQMCIRDRIIQALQNIRSEQAISAILKRATSCLQGLWRRCTKEGCV